MTVRTPLGIGTLLALLVAGAAVAQRAAPRRPVPVHAIAPNIPALHNAVALATLVAIDPKTEVAEFRTGCGWHVKLVGKEQYVRPKSKLPAGLWKVSLRGIGFDLDSAPGKVYGYTQTVSLSTWERDVERYWWSGYLALVKGINGISNGGNTDICHGVLG